MFAVKGIYKGKTVTVNETVPVNEDYDVVITFLHPIKSHEKQLEIDDSKQQRLEKKRETLKSLIGSCQAVPLTLEEIKLERLSRQ